MIYRIATLLFFTVCYTTQAQVTAVNTNARTIPFDVNWKFIKGEIPYAETVQYKDNNWRTLDLPHDWSIEDLPGQLKDSIVGPFHKASIGASSTGYTVGGIGWYRNTFKLNKKYKDKRISIFFDGVYMNNDVWINGHHLGNHPYGYTPFNFDLTPYLKFDGPNVIAVKVNNVGKNSRWYTGSGIYRHVWLTATETVFINSTSVYITTPEVSKRKAVVMLQATLDNTSDASEKFALVVRIKDPHQTVVQTKSWNDVLSKQNHIDIKQHLDVIDPSLWSTSNPSLYTMEIEVSINNKVIDEISTTFGIRKISFSAERGFLLNDERVLLKGACLHHDNGILGARAIDRAEERKVELMKARGFNAIRCSHNPPSKIFLEACDRLGMLVIDEAFDMWQHPKNEDDYHTYFNEWWQRDLDAMLLRDRNHPSIIMWSIGNEIYERADENGLAITKKLADEVRKLDDTRPVTEALCTFWEHPSKTWLDSDSAFSLLDIGGYNYEWRNYISDHKRKPERVMVATESLPQDAYETWRHVEDQSYVIGDFVWTGMDYIGEAGIGHIVKDSINDTPLMGWPWFNANCGDLDLLGNQKPQSYYRDVLWNKRVISMAVHASMNDRTEHISKWGWPDEQQRWSWPGHEGELMDVNVYTKSEAVRLYLNGKVIATKTLHDTAQLTIAFKVAYQPGVLKAIAVDRGLDGDSILLTTNAGVNKIQLDADRNTIQASRNDLAYIAVSLRDENGNVVMDDDRIVTFNISGVGDLAAAGNAHPYVVQSFQQPSCKTYQGKCLAILRPKGTKGSMRLQATSGLLKTSITIQCVQK